MICLPNAVGWQLFRLASLVKSTTGGGEIFKIFSCQTIFKMESRDTINLILVVPLFLKSRETEINLNLNRIYQNQLNEAFQRDK